MIYSASLKATTDDKIRGYTILSTLEEVYRALADNTSANKLIIRSDFAKEYFTPSGIGGFVEDARRLNPNFKIELDNDTEAITEDKFVRKLGKAMSLDEVIMIAETYPKEYFDAMKILTGDYSDLQKQLLAASGRITQLKKTADELEAEKENLRHRLRIEQDNKEEMAARLDALVKRINYQYGVKVDPDIMFKVTGDDYDKVIYIKEITRVQYVDSLIYYLQEILRVLYSMPARTVVIESYYGTGKTRLYPNFVPHYCMTEQDVLSGNILMLGVQPRVLTDILRNPSSISILIVLDRGGYALPHIQGGNVEYFYTASDLADVPEGIPVTRVISYSDRTLFIPYIKEFRSLDNGERMSRYSSMGIVRKLVALIEGRVE